MAPASMPLTFVAIIATNVVSVVHGRPVTALTARAEPSVTALTGQPERPKATGTGPV
jgi:hypothetical protein